MDTVNVTVLEDEWQTWTYAVVHKYTGDNEHNLSHTNITKFNSYKY